MIVQLLYHFGDNKPGDTVDLPDGIALSLIGQQRAIAGNAPAGDRGKALGTLNAYNPENGIFTPPGASIARYRSKMGRAIAGVDRCEILCIGPSTTMGVPNKMRSESYPAYLRARLTALGLPHVFGDWVAAANSTSGLPSSQQDDRWVPSAGWAGFTTWKAFVAYNQGQAAGRTFTFTSPNAGTVLEFLVAGASGAYSYSIDGGAAVNVPAQGTTAFATPIVVTGLANTTHTLVVTTTASYAYVSKARVRPASGITISNFGYSGSSLTEWDSSISPSASTGLDLQTLAFAGFQPDLTIVDIDAWANDLTQDATYTPARAAATITRIVNQVRARNSDVILLNSTAPGQVAYPDPLYQSYRAAMYAAADSTQTHLIDSPERDGYWALQNTLGNKADVYHFTPPGYASIARGVEALITA